MNTILLTASASSVGLIFLGVLPFIESPVSIICDKYHRSSGVSTSTLISPCFRFLCVIFIYASN